MEYLTFDGMLGSWDTFPENRWAHPTFRCRFLFRYVLLDKSPGAMGGLSALARMDGVNLVESWLLDKRDAYPVFRCHFYSTRYVLSNVRNASMAA